MLYCLLTLESCSFQVRERCSLGGKQHRVGGAFANCVSSGCRWPGTQSKMFVFFGSARGAPGLTHCRQEMLLSSETCWAHHLEGIEGFGDVEAPVSNRGKWSAEIGQVIVMCSTFARSELQSTSENRRSKSDVGCFGSAMPVFHVGPGSGFEADTRKRSSGIASKAKVHSATSFWQMWRGGRYLKIRGLCRVLTSSHHEPGGTILVSNILPIATYVFVGLGSLSLGQSLLAIRLIGYQGEVLRLLQLQLPFMYNSCFDSPLPPVVNGFAADFESFAVAPLLLCKTRDAVGPRVEVEVSIVSTVGWSTQVLTSRPRTSAAAHEVAISILALGLRDWGDSGLAVAGVPLAGRMWAETCLPMIIQPWGGQLAVAYQRHSPL